MNSQWTNSWLNRAVTVTPDQKHCNDALLVGSFIDTAFVFMYLSLQYLDCKAVCDSWVGTYIVEASQISFSGRHRDERDKKNTPGGVGKSTITYKDNIKDKQSM